MSEPAHVEKHFTAGDLIRDIVIGMSDGLTVPFALAAGLSSAAISNKIIVTACIAEIAAGSIAMGLGGYLAARSDMEHYDHEREREYREIRELRDAEVRETQEIFESYGLQPAESATLVESLSKRPDSWVDFMMRFELGLEKPEASRARNSSLTIACAYIAGGLVPLSPYIVTATPKEALVFSIAVTLIALAVFGWMKGYFTGTPPFRGAMQTAFIGGLAAAAAFLIARLVS